MLRAIGYLFVTSILSITTALIVATQAEHTPQQIRMLQRKVPMDQVLDLDGRKAVIPPNMREQQHVVLQIINNDVYEMDVYRVMHDGKRYWLDQFDYDIYKMKGEEDVWSLIFMIMSTWAYIMIALQVSRKGIALWALTLMGVEATISIYLFLQGHTYTYFEHALWGVTFLVTTLIRLGCFCLIAWHTLCLQAEHNDCPRTESKIRFASGFARLMSEWDWHRKEATNKRREEKRRMRRQRKKRAHRKQ